MKQVIENEEHFVCMCREYEATYILCVNNLTKMSAIYNLEGYKNMLKDPDYTKFAVVSNDLINPLGFLTEWDCIRIIKK